VVTDAGQRERIAYRHRRDQPQRRAAGGERQQRLHGHAVAVGHTGQVEHQHIGVRAEAVLGQPFEIGGGRPVERPARGHHVAPLGAHRHR
jgi:hypothetical protein